MSWIQKLYETYNNCSAQIGNPMDEIPLLPICHTTQKAQIEIVIDGDGNFKRASVIPKNDSRTIIPCTEESGGRAGKKPTCHPLSDKLQYIAGDFIFYGGEVTSGYSNVPEEPMHDYLSLLNHWCTSNYSHQKAQAVLKYVQRNKLIKDLVDYRVLHVDADGKLIKKWNENDRPGTPDIFKLFQGESWQADSFVRWIVEIPNDSQSSLWDDVTLWASWIKYYLSIKEKVDICFVTGDETQCADQHPRKIRDDGDSSKIISSNDTINFTFRGRFSTADQACTVGYEVTQKAHSALRWLIAKQKSYKRGNRAIVAWSASGTPIPDLMVNTLGLFDDEEMLAELTASNSTAQHLANNLSKLVAGYTVKLGPTDGIVVMGMDSATPGRMAITFYRELSGSAFLDRVLNWHSSCSWWQNYGKDKETKKPIRFIGAPSPSDIAWAAYGRRIDDNLRKSTITRILPCIIDGLPLPMDIAESAFRHACNRSGMEAWEWEKSLGITCAIYRKYHFERRYEMALEHERRTRDYLFGRLLALADGLEGYALRLSNDVRETNAARLMQRFAYHPSSTWKTIALSLMPYEARLGARAGRYKKVIDEVMAAFQTEDFISDKPLTSEFLLGYHCQRKELFLKTHDSDEEQDKQTDENNIGE